jgi:aerobic-type carbon monoxide dehydrogenase small subunit (CoxS/CutS family)
MRIIDHPILGRLRKRKIVKIFLNGKAIEAIEGEPIASALIASGAKAFRMTKRFHHPRGVFCALGRCTDCIMMVDGVPNVRTCITTVREGMDVRTLEGLGSWRFNGKG